MMTLRILFLVNGKSTLKLFLKFDDYCYQEMEETERDLRVKLENAQTALDVSRSGESRDSIGDSKMTIETELDIEASKKAILDKLEERKKELVRCTFPFYLTVLSCLLHF